MKVFQQSSILCCGRVLVDVTRLFFEQNIHFLLKKHAHELFDEDFSLTKPRESSLIRPVARIAQSVEQGIENPRVLGSIPSPGTTI